MTELHELVIDALRTIKDPELPINIHDLGLIRKITIEDGNVQIIMTLTTPNCPVADLMPSEVYEKVALVNGVETVQVELIWDPAWTLEDLSKKGRAVLELMDIDIDHMISQYKSPTTNITINKKPSDD